MSPLVEIAIKATTLLAAAGLVQVVVGRKASAAARHLIWTLTLAAVLALPLMLALLPRWTVEIPVAQATTLAPLGGRVATIDTSLPVAQPASPSVAPTDRAIAASTTDNTATTWPVLVVAIYAIGVLLLLARIGLERLALRRIVRSAHPVTDPAWQHALDDCVRRMRCSQPVQLLQSTTDIMPMTFGSGRATIIVPASADTWADDRRRAVLLHELAHVARRDCLTQTFAAVARAVYWPHPGIWWAARRLRVECELACDDRVLAMGTEARDYAIHLLEIARSFNAAPAVALGMARARQLEGRLIAVLDIARNRSALRRAVRLATIAAALSVIVPIAIVNATIVPVHQTLVSTDEYAPQTSAARQQPAAEASAETTGTWDVYLTNNNTTVQLTLRTTHSSHGHSMPLSRLEGLTASQVTGDGPVHFFSRRDAGTFTFDGVCGRGKCGGTYSFAPSAAFGAELTKRGIGTPTTAQMVRLAMADVGLPLVDELKNNGYAAVKVDDLVRAADHGVDVEFIHELAGLGYRLGTVDELVRLRDHGVDPEYARGLGAQGLAKLSADDLVRGRDHGVDPDFIRGMRALDYKASSLDDFIRLRDHGVDPDFARGMRDAGQKGLLLDQLVKARDHGVDPEFVRDLASLGYKDLSLDDLVRLRDHGVDPAYIRRLQSRGVGHLTVDELVRRRDSGGDEDYVKALFYRAQALWQSLMGRMRG
ncbi:MAG TPA: M56 family metallopeptidase [Vicinamibacterales bacterium]|nr:M56 family metallopeptidase [Vicinamibacterales bacterium]